MDDLKVDKIYVVTVKHEFVGKFSHFKEENGVKYAMFEMPGEDRFGKTYRRVSQRTLHEYIEVPE